MSRSLNKAMLIGNVGADPEVRTTAGGARVATFSLATSRRWTGRTGQDQEKTEWHRVVAWDRLAEVVERFVRKGERLYVEGRIEYRSWEDGAGQTRYSTEIIAQELLLLGSAGAGSPESPWTRATRDGSVGGSTEGERSSQQTEGATRTSAGFDAEDDLPF